MPFTIDKPSGNTGLALVLPRSPCHSNVAVYFLVTVMQVSQYFKYSIVLCSYFIFGSL